jgi:3-hydroxybutyryl-CoA dehydrogenase
MSLWFDRGSGRSRAHRGAPKRLGAGPGARRGRDLSFSYGLSSPWIPRVTTLPHVSIIGAGLMGHGIAADFLDAGHSVTLADISAKMIAEAPGQIGAILAENRNRSFEEVEIRLQRLTTFVLGSDERLAEAVRGAQFVIEAIAEITELKQSLFEKLDAICAPEVILASNTSTIMPTVLAARARHHPERIAIAHYINPPHLVPLVEVVPGEKTAPAVIERLMALLRAAGKQPIALQRETPGFVVNRLQIALLREACHLVETGVTTPAEVDVAIRTSMGRRWAAAGVFEVFDIGGWDVLYNVTSNLLPVISSSTAMPASLQARKDHGELGIKSGTGFYRWDDEMIRLSRARIAALLAYAGTVEHPGERPPPTDQ